MKSQTKKSSNKNVEFILGNEEIYKIAKEYLPVL